MRPGTRRTRPRLLPAAGPVAGAVGSPGSRLAVLVATFLFAVVLVASLLALPDSRADAAASTSESSSGLSLLAPPGYVSPTQSFVARLAIGAGLDRSTLAFEVTVYKKEGTPLGLESTFDGNPNTAVLARSESPIDVSSLPADPADPRAVDLTVPVDAGGVTSPQPGPFTADLQCSIGNCSYVYPVRIALVDKTSSSTVAQLLTYFFYVGGTVEQPLRFALVVPLSTNGYGQTTRTRGAGTFSQSLSELDSLVGGLSQSRVPLTLVPSAETVSSLTSDVASRTTTSARSAQSLVALRALATSPGRETLCGSFADVDAGQLVAGGLASELSIQVHEGGAVLEGAPLRLICPVGGIWVSSTTLGQSALNALGALGYQEVVVPQSSVSGPAPSETWTQTFDLGPTSSQSLLAKTMDPDISSRLSPGSHADPELAADQVLTELDLYYSEQPGTRVPRGVVALAPASWGSDPSFVSALLAGLESNPIVEPVTLADVFSEVPPGQSPDAPPGQPSIRRPVSQSSSDGLPASAIRSVRSRISGFSSAVSAQSPAGAAEAQALNHQLLSAESSTLGSRQQAAAVSAVSDALGAQLRSLSVNLGEIRLTSNAAPVPITVVKRLPYPVTVVVGVKSDKLAFPPHSQDPGSNCRDTTVGASAGRSSFSSTCTIDHQTNVIYVDMRSRASGDFRISVTLTSPAESLVLTSGQITVRSMSTSAVAIALSVLAAVVLAIWWVRTSLRRRKQGERLPAHRRGAHAQAQT